MAKGYIKYTWLDVLEGAQLTASVVADEMPLNKGNLSRLMSGETAVTVDHLVRFLLAVNRCRARGSKVWRLDDLMHFGGSWALIAPPQLRE